MAEGMVAASATERFVEARTCPQCGSVAAKTAMAASKQAEALGFAELGDRWRGFYPETCFFTFDECEICGQVYAPQYLTGAALGSLYASMGDNVHSGDAALSARTQAAYVDMLARHATKVESYLEIGPDVGVLSALIRDRFNIRKAFLAEPNREVWPDLAKVFPASAAQIAENIHAFDSVVPDNSLDLVVGIHVLDHLLRPGPALDWVARKLAPGGVAAFVVHNQRSMLARALGGRWPAYCLQHPQLYAPKTLCGALERTGLKVRGVLPTPNYFPLGYLGAHGLLAVAQVKVDLSWLSLPVRLPLGNMMAVAAKES